MTPIRKRTHRRAVVTAEFAVVFPVLVLMLFSIIEFGWYMSMRQQIVMVTRDAARYGSLPGITPELVEARLSAKLVAWGIDSFDIQTRSEHEDDSVAVVTVPYGELALVGQFLPMLRDSKIVIRARARDELASLREPTG